MENFTEWAREESQEQQAWRAVAEAAEAFHTACEAARSAGFDVSVSWTEAAAEAANEANSFF